ncbi:hypothetical protein ACFWBN_07245 [Streptomyces sp. NPDC059989]|uniref:hypothetical protein n=1 Tax=Streptomyces sp. NPDC059989 TaxID=3347026 RepID=UPI00367902A9
MNSTVAVAVATRPDLRSGALPADQSARSSPRALPTGFARHIALTCGSDAMSVAIRASAAARSGPMGSKSKPMLLVQATSPRSAQVGPGRSVGEEQLELYVPELRLPVLVILVTLVAHRELPGEDQCGAVIVPTPPTPLHDEPVAIVLRGLNPTDLLLDELLKRGPGPRNVVDRIRVESMTSKDQGEQLRTVPPVRGHAGC